MAAIIKCSNTRKRLEKQRGTWKSSFTRWRWSDLVLDWKCGALKHVHIAWLETSMCPQSKLGEYLFLEIKKHIISCGRETLLVYPLLKFYFSQNARNLRHKHQVVVWRLKLNWAQTLSRVNTTHTSLSENKTRGGVRDSVQKTAKTKLTSVKEH